MSQLIIDLLKAKEPLFSTAIQQLEEASGRKAMDVKLTAEIKEKFADRLKQLGLDPADSTGPEIYEALKAKAKEHDIHLAQQLGISDPDNVEHMLPFAKKAVEDTDMPRSCWVLKKSVAKEFLRETPPPNIMERLNYTSIDSMLKKENLFEVYGALRFAEDDEWLNKFNEKYEKLKPTDFETRDIEMVFMPKDRWGDLAKKFIEKKRHFHTHLKELGVVLILPSTEENIPAITTKFMLLSYHYYNEIRLYSAFFKMQQVKKDFGKIFVETLIADPGEQAIMAGQEVHWRVIQRYFGKLKNEYHPEVFEPHVQPEDLHWRKAEEQLYEIDPEMKFWEGLDYVADMYDGRPLTMNLMDVNFSFANNVPYEDRYIYHFREALWNEVFMRYMGEKVLEDQILKQLDNDLIDPDEVGHSKHKEK